MDPYEIITWVPPEGGGGPNYDGMWSSGEKRFKFRQVFTASGFWFPWGQRRQRAAAFQNSFHHLL